MQNTTRQLCTFYLGRLFMGVEVTKVLEVIRSTELTPVPLAPDCVSGLINLRGQIVSALDLRRRLSLPDAKEGTDPVNIVLHREEGPVSMLVDDIGDVITLDDSRFESTPQTVLGNVRDVLEGVYKTDTELLLVIDPDRVVDVS
ncbi:purine-binding chemotaxis protein CheW [Persicimonas caeni]|jgi:purine-binding chemotaxis protein CheW|uniref:Purine-binding chemotaxis protein CheW n=1 Tax=Persicimonas caeni TaxID=2292766 RepID=A0A4Y6PSK3_PERCE|nr:chemotaxis protein CheW [Persicimonas caeni]QDG51314.1 purine-binding chemotaxis protein CheW [Persicimonas caeni]QED32535.1 purine-binding chemotaxis protein CheW [Persicimonas caeni]